jgi:hypothetical protein
MQYTLAEGLLFKLIFKLKSNCHLLHVLQEYSAVYVASQRLEELLFLLLPDNSATLLSLLPLCCAFCTPQEYSAVYVASQRLEELLELMTTDGDTRPLVVTSRDRLDIVMGLLASQVRHRKRLHLV